jgi:serpin B
MLALATWCAGWAVVRGQDAASPANATVVALARANNALALDLLRTSQPGNAIFSPYSIATALAMTWTGARGETAAQMAQVLHMDKVPVADVGPGYRELRETLMRTEAFSGTELNIANALWPDQSPEHPLLPAFVDAVNTDFGAMVATVNYQDADAARARINAWVTRATKDKITDLLHAGDVNAGTRLVLVNAIHFKAAWWKSFEKSDTREAPFHLADGSARTVPLMHKIEALPYTEITDGPAPCQVLVKMYAADPYSYWSDEGQETDAVVLLPRTADGLAALEKVLTPERLDGWLAQAKGQEVEVFLPKFRLEARQSLGEQLAELGMRDAFVNPGENPGPTNADFSGMDGVRNFFVGRVIHQAMVDVDEKGTEAAAATAVVMMTGAAFPTTPPPPPPVFRADRPFLFLIRDKATGTILFIGRMTEPEAK